MIDAVVAALVATSIAHAHAPATMATTTIATTTIATATDVPVTPLEKCKAESQALHTTRLVAVCTAAGDDATQPKSDRVEALRVLGIALMTEGAPDLAEEAFRKMLALDPDAALGADAGPSAQKVLAKAHHDLDQSAAAALPPATSSVPTSAKATPEAVARDVVKPAASSGAALSPAVSWTLVGVGAAVAATSATLFAASVYDRYYNRVPCSDGRASCVPDAPLLFGLYPQVERKQFFDAASAWVGGSAVGVAVGVTVAAVGVAFALQ